MVQRAAALPHRVSVICTPAVALPSKRPGPACASWASAVPVWSRITSEPCSKVHLRLVKKFAGHPPSGAIVPSPAPSAPANVMLHWLDPAAASSQRPAIGSGGAESAPTPGAAAGAGGPGRSLAQPVSASNAEATASARKDVVRGTVGPAVSVQPRALRAVLLTRLTH